MHPRFLLLHLIIFVATRGANLPKQVLSNKVYEQRFPNFYGSQSGLGQYLLLFVVKYRPRSCLRKVYFSSRGLSYLHYLPFPSLGKQP